MDMTLRWFGEGVDSVSLEQIRQIPGVKGVITTLYDIPAGEEWPMERILQMKEKVEAKGLKVMGIESVNIHDAIKVGTPDREKYIANYITTLERLGQADIHVVCYNFMPVFDWTRSDLAKVRPDGSTVLAYDQKEIDKINPENMFESMGEKSNGFELPGWEPERMARIKELFEMYKDVDEEKLFNNLVYFLKAIQPVCEKYDIRMAIHPDDPAWPVFGLSRIITDKEHLLKLMKAVDAPFNGVTLCTGSLGSNPENDIPDIIERFKNREKEVDRKRTEQSFMVPKKDIVENEYDLSINKYKEVEYIPVEYPPTSEIMANIRELENEIGKEMDELEKLLKM